MNTIILGGGCFWCTKAAFQMLKVKVTPGYAGGTTKNPNYNKVIKGKPKYIQTDAGVFYPREFRKLFYSNKIGGLAIEHKIQNYQTTRIHNYRIETVFMKIKDRVIDFRGLKALWSAPILMTAIVIQHNFIEAHTTINEIPCEKAGVKLVLSENRWLDLIRLLNI